MTKSVLHFRRRQIILSMKFVCLFLIIGVLQASGKVLSQRISLEFKEAPLEKALSVIKKQSGYVFFYSYGTLDAARPITLKVKNADIREVLDLCFKNQPLTYSIEDKSILIAAKKNSPEAPSSNKSAPLPALEQADIRGLVTDSLEKPIEGVSVSVKGTGRGALTTAGGNFQVEAKLGDTLIFDMVGYRKKEVIITKMNTVLRVRLLEAVSNLDNIIIVGYGTQKKRDVTGAIVSVGEKTIKEAPTSNVLSAIQGQVAGVDIERSTGGSQPGSVPEIRIRGSRSITGSNNPLYVVDGIPFNGSLNNLNQNDIVSLQVLKDASATAIYGSRAANGVVLITTRRGKSGETRLNYNNYFGQVRRIGEYDLMNAAQFITFKKWSKINGNFSGATPKYSGLDDPQFEESGDPTFTAEEKAGIADGISTNWQNLIYQNGFQTNHDLSFSGGTQNTQFAVSGGFYDQTGIYPGQSFKRFSLKISIDHRFSKIFKAGVNLINNYSIINGENANPLEQALRASPLVGPYDADGNLYGFVPGSNSQVWNPLANLVEGVSVETRKRLGVFGTGYLEAAITPDLTYRLNAGAEIRPESYGNYYASDTYNNMGGLSTAANSNSDFYNYTVENVLTYDKVFNTRHHLNFTGLFSLQEQRDNGTQFNYNDLLSNSLQFYNPGYGSNLSGTGSESKYDIISYMGRINYAYLSKYLVTLTMRSDGSSVLAPGNKYHVFPSAALGWNIDRENFMKSQDWVSQLKLRLSYGSVGNAAVSPYSTVGGLSSIPYNYGSTNVTGAYPTDVPNPNLTWEYTKTLNVGLDFGILRDRITGAVEFYQQKTHNLLLGQSLPATSGIQNPTTVNVGRTENRGLEISLTSKNIVAKRENGFNWTTSVNVSFNRNKITALAGDVTKDIANNRFVGFPINPFYNYKRLGIWQNTPADSALAQSFGLSTSGSTSVIGTIKVADINGDGVINSDDRMILGSTSPRYTGGLTNHLSFKGFDLVVVATFKEGGLISASMLQPGSYINTFQGNYNNLNVHYWTPEVKENYWPKPNAAQTNPTYGDLLGYIDGSYLKIKTITLGYSLPQDFARKLSIKSLRIYASAYDPFILFSPFKNKFHGLDPETRNSIGVNTPSVKSILIGLNASF